MNVHSCSLKEQMAARLRLEGAMSVWKWSSSRGILLLKRHPLRRSSPPRIVFFHSATAHPQRRPNREMGSPSGESASEALWIGKNPKVRELMRGALLSGYKLNRISWLEKQGSP